MSEAKHQWTRQSDSVLLDIVKYLGTHHDTEKYWVKVADYMDAWADVAVAADECQSRYCQIRV